MYANVVQADELGACSPLLFTELIYLFTELPQSEQHLQYCTAFLWNITHMGTETTP